MENILSSNITNFIPDEYFTKIAILKSDDSLAYKKIYTDEYGVENSYDRQETITHPMWSEGKSELIAVYTSSLQSFPTRIYYRDVYDRYDLSNGVQFSIAYGDVNGFGSTTGSNDELPYNVYESKAIYSQYYNLLINHHTSSTDFPKTHFYAISVNSINMKDSITQGGWQLSLSKVNTLGTVDNLTTPITLIDESIGITDKKLLDEYVYKIKEGTLTDGLDETPSFDSWGFFYPKNGIILLDGAILSSSGYLISDRSPATGSGAVYLSSNADRLFTSISGAMVINNDDYPFRATATERLESIVTFIRVLADDFNYTNNTSAVSDLENYEIKPITIENGYNFTYITQIGLYNDDNELLAVAKLSKPIRKTKDTELVMRIRIRN
jgi:hypothetical protein